MPSQYDPALGGARLGVRVGFRGLGVAVHRPLALDAPGWVHTVRITASASADSAERRAFSSLERPSAVSRRRSSRRDSTFFVRSFVPPASW